MSKFGEILNKVNPDTVGAKIKNALDEESYQDFLKAIQDNSVPLPRIRKALAELDISVSKGTLDRWRKGLPPMGAR